MVNSLFVRSAGLVAGLVLSVSACAGGGSFSKASAPSSPVLFRSPPATEYGAALNYKTRFDSVRDIFSKSDEVVVARVAAEQRGPAESAHGVTTTQRRLTLSVKEWIKGSGDASITVETFGWITDGDGEKLLPDVEGVGLRVGDTVVAALAVSPDRSRRGLANPQAVYLLEQGQVVDTPREDVLPRELEELTEKQFRQRLAARQ